MKYITKYKSPNYNSRKNSKIQLIIIHYTALKNTLDAIAHLCNKENKVSSHYLISQKGIVYNLVDDKLRAWHAGLSFWQDYKDINSISIGIELDYNPYGKNNKFSYKMILSLKKLKVIVTLGKVAFDNCIKLYKQKFNIKQKYIFKHGKSQLMPIGLIILSSYHPSPRNVNTKLISDKMMVDLFKRAKKLAKF